MQARKFVFILTAGNYIKSKSYCSDLMLQKFSALDLSYFLKKKEIIFLGHKNYQKDT